MSIDIQVSRIQKVFQSKSGPVEALSNIDFEIGRHEFVSVLGPSGCGKSTLMRIVGGLIAPTSGKVMIHDQEIKSPHPEVGIVFQKPVLFPWRTVQQNVELQPETRGADKTAYRKEAKRLLEQVGLAGFEDRFPHELSGGMQQRVSLCRALIHDPLLLLMDEPFGALDALTREQMNLELQRLWMETRKTVLFITHSITEAAFLSDRVVIMSARPGRVQETIRVELPRPRTLESMRNPAFLEVVDRARACLMAKGFSD